MVHAKKDTLYIITKIPWGTFDPLQFQARACLFREKKYIYYCLVVVNEELWELLCEPFYNILFLSSFPKMYTYVLYLEESVC